MKVNKLRNNKNQICIQTDFTHGFIVLSKEKIVEYKVTNFMKKDLERKIIWKDSSISIEWPKLSNNLAEPNLSSNDKNGLKLKSNIKKGKVFR